MSRFQRVLEENKEAVYNTTKKEDYSMPLYGINGQIKRTEKKGIIAKIKIKTIIVAIILCILYIPQIFINSSQVENEPLLNITYDTNASALNSKARNENPTSDYDKDGLTNEEERKLQTNPWSIDSDMDGYSDSYESIHKNLNPIKADKNLIKWQKEKDKAEGSDVSDPYKIGNVILWAQDYESKTYGSVIETLTGYRFCDFSGYAQFPDYENIYVYEIKNGKRCQLSFLKKEQAWKINGTTEVEIYKEPLKEIVQFSFFGHSAYVNENAAFNILAIILPDEGILTATKMTEMDIDPDIRNATSASTQLIKIDKENYNRFTHQDNTLEDLVHVRKAINDGACVAISLFSYDYGEMLAICYGYTYTGDLLLADFDTLKPIGTLTIDETATKIMLGDGSMVSYPYFKFKGFGFNSDNGDKISFFATNKSSGEYNSHFTENLN